MSEKRIVDQFGRPYGEDNLITEPGQENIASIIEGRGYGEMQLERAGLAEAKTNDREEEAIRGKAAVEFSEEAKLHPERYQYIADYIEQLVNRYGLTNPFIMDFGSGPGILTTKIAEKIPSARVIGVDLSEDMLAVAQDNIEEKKLERQASLIHYNAKEVHGNTGELADIVVSRNMLHRLEVLQEGLLAMARASKNNGGMIFNTSFRNLNDLNPEGQKYWIKDFHERDGYPALQEAWVLAYMNAPTLEQYQTAAKQVAGTIDAEDMQVSAGKFNEVNIFLKKKN